MAHVFIDPDAAPHLVVQEAPAGAPGSYEINDDLWMMICDSKKSVDYFNLEAMWQTGIRPDPDDLEKNRP